MVYPSNILFLDGLEISAWLSDDTRAAAANIQRFAILDDCDDMAYLASHFFMCDGQWGLTDEVADMVIEYLNA